MGFFSFLKPKEKTLRCDWCGKEINKALYTKYENKKKFVFCSEACKNYFKKSGIGKRAYKRCASCPMSPKSWD